MIRLVTRGRFTRDFIKALTGAPEDREPVVRKLIESVGGKVISYYVTTGETDFLLISEANEGEAVIAALMAASGAGSISHVSTVRAWQSGESIPTSGQEVMAQRSSPAQKLRQLRDVHRNPSRLIAQTRVCF
jgi:uncharacterized protein with GYD domain